ncbi:MAG: alpha/beta hydrolase [Planctomycetota bacterium]
MTVREFTLPGPLVLLPGLGAGPGLLEPQKELFGDDLITPDWIKPRGAESLAKYAERWAPAIADLLPDDGRPVCVGGISFGAMIALDLARHLDARGVVVIAGCVAKEEVPSQFLFAQKFGSLLPGPLWPSAVKALAIPFALMDGAGDDGIRLLKAEAATADIAALRWGAQAVEAWDGPEHPDTLPPIARVHGKGDWVIPCPPQGVDTVLDDGKHLIHLTHRRSVAGFIEQACRGFVDPENAPRLAAAASG